MGNYFSYITHAVPIGEELIYIKKKLKTVING